MSMKLDFVNIDWVNIAVQWVPGDLKIRKLVDVDYGSSLSISVQSGKWRIPWKYYQSLSIWNVLERFQISDFITFLLYLCQPNQRELIDFPDLMNIIFKNPYSYELISLK